jgi:tripartite-type tricarboxylate transporter receptor subunit TctC
MKRLIVLTAAATMAALSCTHSYAQGWPTKPVRIVVPQSPGGGADTVGRLIAQYLSDALHQNFFVENRPGASGMIGSAVVAHTDPDGYNFVIAGMPSHVVGPAASANPEYDPVKDFTHVAYVGGAPLVLAAHPSLGVKSIKDLIALAKKDTINYGTPGVGSLGNLLGEYLAKKAKIKLVNIPYKGGSKVVSDLLAGHVKIGITSLTPTASLIRAGKLVPLAVTSSKRLAKYPTVPTLKELGYNDLVAIAWWTISGPAHLPNKITGKMHDIVNQAIETSTIRQRLERLNMIIEAMSQEDAARLVVSEGKKWGPIARSILAAGRHR